MNYLHFGNMCVVGVRSSSTLKKGANLVWRVLEEAQSFEASNLF